LHVWPRTIDNPTAPTKALPPIRGGPLAGELFAIIRNPSQQHEGYCDNQYYYDHGQHAVVQEDSRVDHPNLPLVPVIHHCG
jgi:hypothetical protein